MLNIEKLKEWCWNNLEFNDAPDTVDNSYVRDIINGYNGDCYTKDGSPIKYSKIRFMFDENKDYNEYINFSGIEFEKNLPRNMRFKEYDIIDKSLYWVTQDYFNDCDLKRFELELNKTEFEYAYVICRDDSTYNFSKDKNSNAMRVICNKIELKEIKENDNIITKNRYLINNYIEVEVILNMSSEIVIYELWACYLNTKFKYLIECSLNEITIDDIYNYYDKILEVLRNGR